MADVIIANTRQHILENITYARCRVLTRMGLTHTHTHTYTHTHTLMCFGSHSTAVHNKSDAGQEADNDY